MIKRQRHPTPGTRNQKQPVLRFTVFFYFYFSRIKTQLSHISIIFQLYFTYTKYTNNVFSIWSFKQLSNTTGEKSEVCKSTHPNYDKSVYILKPKCTAELIGIFNKIDSQPVEWLSGNNHLQSRSAINLSH